MKFMYKLAQLFTLFFAISIFGIWFAPAKKVCEPCLYTKEGVRDGFSVKWAVSKNHSEIIGFLEAKPKQLCWEEYSEKEAVFALVMVITGIIAVVLHLLISYLPEPLKS